MRRVAFTLITGKSWTGGYNYLLNLLQVLTEYAPGRVQPVLFVGTDVTENMLAAFTAIDGVRVVRSRVFEDACKAKRLREAILIGCDRAAAHSFQSHEIDVVFEYTQFYGWRFPLPCVAWLTDFQHRHLRELFSTRAYWKREAGFRAQVYTGRSIMLSSDDSRSDCETFIPQSIGKTTVVRFAVRPPDLFDCQSVRAIADGYHLPKRFFYLPNQFWIHKNHRVVIEALHLAKQEGHDIVVASSGDPVDYRSRGHYAALESKVAFLGLSDNFRFLGMVPRHHVFALMRASTALINPSLSEGWSTCVEEAKSLGVPLLLSDLRVHREQAGDSALYFNPRSGVQLASLLALQHNLSTSSRREVEESAIAASRNRVKQFAIDFSDLVERTAVPLRTTRRSPP